ncbi:hypothetical protein TomTYG45_10960 [Sphingobium sp. TomTYG45]
MAQPESAMVRNAAPVIRIAILVFFIEMQPDPTMTVKSHYLAAECRTYDGTRGGYQEQLINFRRGTDSSIAGEGKIARADFYTPPAGRQRLRRLGPCLNVPNAGAGMYQDR